MSFLENIYTESMIKIFSHTLSREIKHPLSKSPTRPKKGGGGLLTHPFLIHIFWVFPPRNKKKAQTFLAASPREFFVKKGGVINPGCFILRDKVFKIGVFQIWRSDCFKNNYSGKIKTFRNFKTPNSLFEQTTAWKKNFLFAEKVTRLPTESHLLI